MILLGNSGVGKSNLIARFHNNDFCEDFESTVGVEFVTKRINVDGVPVKLQVCSLPWHTCPERLLGFPSTLSYVFGACFLR